MTNTQITQIRPKPQIEKILTDYCSLLSEAQRYKETLLRHRDRIALDHGSIMTGNIDNPGISGNFDNPARKDFLNDRNFPHIAALVDYKGPTEIFHQYNSLAPSLRDYCVRALFCGDTWIRRRLYGEAEHLSFTHAIRGEPCSLKVAEEITRFFKGSSKAGDNNLSHLFHLIQPLGEFGVLIIPKLTDLLTSGDSKMVLLALRLLPLMAPQPGPSIEPFITPFITSRSFNIKIAALEALEALGTVASGAESSVAQLLTDATKSDVRLQAACTLRAIAPTNPLAFQGFCSQIKTGRGASGFNSSRTYEDFTTHFSLAATGTIGAESIATRLALGFEKDNFHQRFFEAGLEILAASELTAITTAPVVSGLHNQFRRLNLTTLENLALFTLIRIDNTNAYSQVELLSQLSITGDKEACQLMTRLEQTNDTRCQKDSS